MKKISLKNIYVFSVAIMFFVSAASAQNDKKDFTGGATYYSNKFKGRKTASGEIYDPEKLTAAIRRNFLPFKLGTQVEVTNPKNNKKVIVTINDYMSDKAKDVIDLSYKAAVQIDLIRAGRLKVKIRALSPGSSSDSTVAEKITNGDQPAP